MLKFIVIGVALIFVGSIESKSIDPFIIGGRNASEGQFPYFASIRGDDMAHGLFIFASAMISALVNDFNV